MLKAEQFISLFQNNLDSKGHFTLIDICTSHSQLLYRSTKFSGEGGAENMDLLFAGVTFMTIPLSLMDLRQIYEVTTTGTKELDVLIEPHIQGRKLIKLDYGNGKAFVVLERVMCSKNKLPPESTSIPSKLEKPITEEGIHEMAKEIENLGYSEYRKRFDDDWVVII